MKRRAGGHSVSLQDAVSVLLSTPAVNDMGDNKSIEWWDEWAPRQVSSTGAAAPHGKSLSIEVRKHDTDWGPYAEAIARWERVRGVPAPEPTVIGDKGTAQLSPAFVEFMMGLPAGWVTDVPGVARRPALKALGNGVVPQQAEAALTELLARTEEIKTEDEILAEFSRWLEGLEAHADSTQGVRPERNVLAYAA